MTRCVRAGAMRRAGNFTATLHDVAQPGSLLPVSHLRSLRWRAASGAAAAHGVCLVPERPCSRALLHDLRRMVTADKVKLVYGLHHWHLHLKVQQMVHAAVIT